MVFHAISSAAHDGMQPALMSPSQADCGQLPHYTVHKLAPARAVPVQPHYVVSLRTLLISRVPH